MRKYDNYDSTQAFTGEFEQLEPGGYICKILKVTCEEKEYGHLLRIGFDIAEGEHKDFYKRKYDASKEQNPDAKWPGMYYQTVKEDDLRFFKGFITAVENSNQGYKWSWDEKTLTGKFFGGVFGEEEYINSQKQIRTSVKCQQVRSVDQIRKGITPPEIKRLNGSKAPSTFQNSNMDMETDLPF